MGFRVVRPGSTGFDHIWEQGQQFKHNPGKHFLPERRNISPKNEYFLCLVVDCDIEVIYFSQMRIHGFVEYRTENHCRANFKTFRVSLNKNDSEYETANLFERKVLRERFGRAKPF